MTHPSFLEFEELLPAGNWVRRTLFDFLAANDDGLSRRTVVFVHGNRTTEDKAKRHGLATYDKTFLNGREAAPIRFVIWSWPSDRIRGEIRDVRTKAAGAECHAFHLARMIDLMNEHRQVSIIGYSFGGKLAINALHLLGEGSIDGQRILLSADGIPPVNLTLVAPAIRNDCFCVDRWQALTRINSMFVMYNSRDRYLQLYKFARFDGMQPALGYTGMRQRRAGFLPADRIEQFDAARRVGPDHSYLEYIGDKRIEALIRANIFYEE